MDLCLLMHPMFDGIDFSFRGLCIIFAKKIVARRFGVDKQATLDE